MILLLLACSGPTGDSPENPGETGLEVLPDDTGDTTVTDDSGDEPEDTAPDPDDEADYAALFDTTSVQRIDLTLSEEAIASLQADSETYVSGTFAHGQRTLEEIGVKLRGSEASRDWNGKPSFRLKLNEFDDGQDYGGLERIVLDAMNGDAAQARQVFSAAVLASAGIAAPKANYAEVWVNGELFGLYANVEAIDDHWVARTYTDGSGDLWKALEEADFTDNGVEHFEHVSGEGTIDELDDARRAVFTSGDFYTDAALEIDMPQFLQFWAWNIAIGNADAYPHDLNDFSLYDDPADDLIEFSTPGLGESWDDEMDLEFSSLRGMLGVKCAANEACREDLLLAVEEAVDFCESADLAELAEEVYALSEEAASDDPRRASLISEVIVERANLTALLDSWPTTVRAELEL